jgi:hypothetical protein
MTNEKRLRKNCPECRYWKSSRRSHSCTKNPERPTYTSLTLPDKPSEREWCTDMKKRRKS